MTVVYGLFPIHATKIASTIDDQNKFSFKTKLGYYMYIVKQQFIYTDKVSFLKSLEPSHGVLQLLKKNFYSVLILH